MVEFINKVTGGKILIDESRAEEYKKLGHKPVVSFAVKSKSKPEVKSKSIESAITSPKTNRKKKL